MFRIKDDQTGPFRNGWTCHASITSLRGTRANVGAAHSHVGDAPRCMDEASNHVWPALCPQSDCHLRLMERRTSINGKGRLLFVWIGCIERNQLYSRHVDTRKGDIHSDPTKINNDVPTDNERNATQWARGNRHIDTMVERDICRKDAPIGFPRRLGRFAAIVKAHARALFHPIEGISPPGLIFAAQMSSVGGVFRESCHRSYLVLTPCKRPSSIHVATKSTCSSSRLGRETLHVVVLNIDT